MDIRRPFVSAHAVLALTVHAALGEGHVHLDVENNRRLHTALHIALHTALHTALP